VAVDDMIKKMGGAADYKGLSGLPRGAAAPDVAPCTGAAHRPARERCLRQAAQDFDRAANPMYNHAFSRCGVEKGKAGKKQARQGRRKPSLEAMQ